MAVESTLQLFSREIGKYTGFVGNAVKEITAYRLSALAWTFMPILFLLINYYLWKGIFSAGGGSLVHIGWQQYLTYIGIGFLTARITICSKDMYIAGELKNGNVAMALLKPYSFHGMVFARHLGEKAVYILQTVPMLLVVVLLTKPSAASPGVWSAWGASVVFSFLINYGFAMLIGTLAFWITNVWGLMLLRNALRTIFDGGMIAIALLFQIGAAGIPLKNLPLAGVPEAAVKGFFTAVGVLSYCLPFQAMYYTPSGIFAGMIRGAGPIALHLCIQVFWVLAFFAANALLWKRALRKITVMGG